MKKNSLTIITPTYNRKKQLNNLYASLKKQNNKNFQWLIIDDGSTDGTEQIVKKFKNDSFPVEYYKKNNGGKHTALNESHKYIKGDYIIIVDSDDTLVQDSIDTIYEYIKIIDNNPEVAYISFQRGSDKKSPLAKKINSDGIIANHIKYRINENRIGDCSEVVKTEIFKKYPFPEYENERFLSEGYLWAKIAQNYNALYSTKIIYICNYLEGGLTKSGRNNRIKSPLGGMAAANAFLEAKHNPKLSLRRACKFTLVFIIYSKFANKNYTETTKECNRRALAKILYPFGFILYLKWRKDETNK